MTDREKVIMGLECRYENKQSKDCEHCHYGMILGRRWGCDFIHMSKDALALLKAQEPRVLTLDEVKASKGTDMYLEISARPVDVPYITAATLDGVGVKGVAFYHSSFAFLTYNRRYYGWRCWTSRPTDAQREEAPWEN